jgi:putative ABC transport system substrate-binding protein
MPFDQLHRREFITLLGGAAAVWPVGARAQQSERVRRIGFLHDYNEVDPEGRVQVVAFREALQKLGWTDGRNVLIEYRSGAAADNELLRKYATEIVAHEPDVVLTSGTTITAALQRASRSIPIVFVNVTDPVGAGLVATLARPESNASGFTQFEFGISAKWLELLKEIAPTVTRVIVIRDPTARTGGGQLGAIQAVAPSLGVDVRPVDPHNPDDIERAISVIAGDAKSGLIVTSSRLARVHRELIVNLAARRRMPAIYAFRVYLASGGLMFYGPDATNPYRRAAGYVDRILKGEKPADLPVQVPTKYELVLNLKTAKALGLEVPPTLLARADEVIE